MLFFRVPRPDAASLKRLYCASGRPSLDRERYRPISKIQCDLPDRKRSLTGLYGRDGELGRTVEELRQQVGLTVEGVQQLARRALSRLGRQGRRVVEYWR